MQRVVRKSLLAGAQEAEGIAVVIDVLRAFTCAALMSHLGAEKIVLAAEPEAILDLKADRGYLAVGEVVGAKVPGFDLGNSPTHILAAGRQVFAGRTVAQRTSAGVTGAVAAAKGAEMVILGSYVTAAAITRYIQGLVPEPEVVSLIAMGAAGRLITPDDEYCAGYLEHLLAGRPYDHLAALQEIIRHSCAEKFLRAEQEHFPPADPIYALQRDLFDFVLVATHEEGDLVARRIDV